MPEASKLPARLCRDDKRQRKHASFHQWADRQAGLNEIRRILKAKGLFVLVEQPRTSSTEAMITELASHHMSQLATCGFVDIRHTAKAMKPAASVAAIGINECTPY